MRPKILPGIFATFLNLPIVKSAIINYATARPHVHLADLDGTMYMHRWRVIDEFIWDDEIKGDNVFGVRSWGSHLLELLTGYRGARLHLIHRADHDRDVHNHPFIYRTVIFKGWYEETANANPQYGQDYETHTILREGDTALGGGFHRINAVSEGGVLTLFFMGENTGAWGFWVHRFNRFMKSRDYFNLKGYTNEHRITSGTQGSDGTADPGT